MDLKERLAQFRAEEQRLSWEGTFLEYFEFVKAQPQIAGLAHARVHDMIMSQGASTDENGRKVFGFFKNDIFGVEKPLEQLVEYFSSAAKRLEVRKRILLLMGPVGGGKSTIVSLLKRGMENFSRTEEGAVYAIKGWPMLGMLRRLVGVRPGAPLSGHPCMAEATFSCRNDRRMSKTSVSGPDRPLRSLMHGVLSGRLAFMT